MQASTKLKAAAIGLVFGLALFASLPAGAQQAAKVPLIGMFGAGDYSGGLLTRRLQELGYVDGKNIAFVYRDREGNCPPNLVAELVRLKVDVIFAVTNQCAFAAKMATSTIPIVVFGAHGALDTGLIPSLGRPDGNVTGVESLAPELDAKRVELLKQIVPGLSQLAVLYDAGDQGSPIHLKWTQAAARVLSVTVSPLEVRRLEDFDTVLATLAGKPVQGLLMFTDNLTFEGWQRVSEFALKNRLPTICEFKELVQAGCLVSYGPAFAEFAQINARQIDKILKGAKPADVPMEQPTRFELVINLKTAKALGVTIPNSVRIRADHVIE